MSRTCQVAILGRPNVGKSTLFNYLTRSKQSLVRDEPGVTRDILVGEAHWWGRSFEVLDTGGLTEAQDEFSPLIRTQVLNVIGEVSALILVFDGRVGLVPEDRDILRIAKESGKPFLCVVNKVDRYADEEFAKSDFYEFGYPLVSTSFERGQNVDIVVEWVLKILPDEVISSSSDVRIALIGKPNVGKSSLCNYLLKKDRMVVSPLAGTTVDPVEEIFEYKQNKIEIVDTAGLRARARRKEGVERLSAVKANQTAMTADVLLLVIDAVEGPSTQDARIVEPFIEEGKPLILVANKQDLASKEPAFRKRFREQVEREFHFFPDIRIVFVSAVTGRGMEEMLDLVLDVWNRVQAKISTRELNDFFFEVIRGAPAPVYETRNVKFYYLTQTHQRPPSFICFANHPEGVTPSYRRYLIKRIQERWDLVGIPIRLYVFKSHQDGGK